MSGVVQNPSQEFWRSPTVLEPLAGTVVPAPVQDSSDACAECGSEFMVGGRFCHTCGLRRPMPVGAESDTALAVGLARRSLTKVKTCATQLGTALQGMSLPSWIRYLHFHEIQRIVGLPTAALIAFLIGLGCVAGAVGVSLFYKASNLAEFQAIQMWRIEWLLAATTSFVAGILLKSASRTDRD